MAILKVNNLELYFKPCPESIAGFERDSWRSGRRRQKNKKHGEHRIAYALLSERLYTRLFPPRHQGNRQVFTLAEPLQGRYHKYKV